MARRVLLPKETSGRNSRFGHLVGIRGTAPRLQETGRGAFFVAHQGIISSYLVLSHITQPRACK